MLSLIRIRSQKQGNFLISYLYGYGYVYRNSIWVERNHNVIRQDVHLEDAKKIFVDNYYNYIFVNHSSSSKINEMFFYEDKSFLYGCSIHDRKRIVVFNKLEDFLKSNRNICYNF